MTVLPPQAVTVFVGREHELGLLRAALAAAMAGHGRLVMLAGEPGIGKTRLAEEIAAHAATEGATVRWGHCWDGAGAPAFWPWIQILRSQFAETDAAELRAQLGAGAGDVAQLVPEVHERVPAVAAVPLADDAGARFRLFDSVARFLRAAAVGRPLALIIEDVHWADAASTGLLRFLADEMKDARLLIVATYRDVGVSAPHPLGELLGVLAYHPLVERVELQGLSADEIGALVEALGHERSASLVRRVHRESGGNPFFATEIVRALGAGMPASIPGTVRDAIGDRLRRLSEACRRLLGIASVIGSEFGLATLERVVAEVSAAGGTSEVGDGTPVLQLLSEATNARVVAEVPEAVSDCRFSHALIREVLYEGLLLEVRLRLHLHVATALEALGEASREFGANALAHHFLAAVAGCAEGMSRQACVDKAALYVQRAAVQATAMCAYEEAAAHCERALHALETWAPYDTGRQCELLLTLGEVQTRARPPYRVRARTYHRAAALARARGEPDLLIRAALGIGTMTSVVEAANDAHAALLREALDAVGPHDSITRAQLLGWLALARYYPDPRLHSIPLSEEAVAMARRVGDPRTLGLALRSRYHTLIGAEHARERMALATEILQLGKQVGDAVMAMNGQSFRLNEALELGQVATVERELAVFERQADELREPIFCSRVIVVRAALALLAGRFADAEQLAREALQLLQHAEDASAMFGYLEQLGLAYWEQGRLGEIEGILTGSVELTPHIPGTRAALAWFYAEEGRTDEARAEIERLSDDDLGGLPRVGNWLFSMAELADACAVIGDATHAATLYDLLLPYAQKLVFERSGLVCLGSVSFWLGVLAGTMGRCDDALRHLDEGLAAHQHIPSPPWIANAQCAMAAVLLGRNGPGDRERAGALLAEVLRTTERLGMRRLQRKAQALQEPMEAGAAAQPETKSSALKKREAAPATFRKEGEYWVIGYKAPTFRLKDRIGLRYLAVLLGNSGRDFLATDLASVVHGGDDESAVRNGRPCPALGGGEPYFDEQARREYGRRLRDLGATFEEAQAFNDVERASRAQAEIDSLAEELARGIGLGRRIRASGSPIERARVNVTHAIKAALQAIAANDAALGRYLAATIKTGSFCCYSPDPQDAVAWKL
jgi:tetratricopeptide (TPR) repeat protein